MKIAVAGAHRTGKTTLADILPAASPDFHVVEEPYVQLIEEGHSFSEMPGLSDFELQLERSIESILGADENVVFDRCPYDILAYLLTHEDRLGFDIDRRLPRVLEAVRGIDLIVFVPIENPDRIACDERDTVVFVLRWMKYFRRWFCRTVGMPVSTLWK